jgi:CheY-like chemotaxis protein
VNEVIDNHAPRIAVSVRKPKLTLRLRFIGLEQRRRPAEETILTGLGPGAVEDGRENLCRVSVGPKPCLPNQRSTGQAFMENVRERPVRVVVVDDSPEFRDLVISMVHSQPELQVIGEACNGEEAVRKIEALRPDLVLLDLGLPILNGFEVTGMIRKTTPQSKIIFVSQESSPDVVHKALRLGAYGYVLKSDVESELLPAVSKVLDGKTFLSRTLAGGDAI